MAVVLLSLAFTVGVNVFTYSLPYRWDVTAAKQHTLTSSTIDFVKKVNKPVELTALYVGLPPKYLQDLLKEYERMSNGNIKTEIIDPIEKISYAAKFGNVISGKERKVIIRSGDERKDIDFSDSLLTEEQLTNALVRVTREKRRVYFLTGHGEFSLSSEENQGLSLFAKLLNANNMTTNSLMLGIEESIPEDCDVLVIAGPRNELTEKEQELIEDYLNRGGDALFLIENTVVTTPDKPLTAEEEDKNPSLNNILNQWGVNIGKDIVVDLSSHIGQDVGSPATRNYMRHKAITAGLDYTFYVRPRSISVLEERRPSIKLAPIVLTATKESSWAETNRTLAIHFDKAEDIPGPVAISFVIWEVKEEGDKSDTRIIAFTDADFLTNIYINQYSNAEMGLNIVNWLSELDYSVFLDQKVIKVERLDLTSKQRRMIAAMLFLMPLFIAAGGILVWMRR
ncbi:MAG: GldG family protein [Pseudomonadales bacterium]